MVQTSPTSDADQPDAVRVIGILLILLGGWRVYSSVNTVMQLIERAIDASPVVFFLIVPGVVGLFTVIAGILLVRHDGAGKVFGLVVCSIALAYQLLSFASTLTSLYALGRSPTLSLGMLFWLINAVSIALYLAGIIVIARWHPHRVPSV